MIGQVRKHLLAGKDAKWLSNLTCDFIPIHNAIQNHMILRMKRDDNVQILRNNGYAIMHVPNPPIWAMEIAVKAHPCSIFYIDNPPNELQVMAVIASPLAIQCIDNPCCEVVILDKALWAL